MRSLMPLDAQHSHYNIRWVGQNLMNRTKIKSEKDFSYIVHP